MKTFRNIMISVIVLLLFFFGVLLLSNNMEDYARITALEYSAIVVDEEDSDGKVIITERLTFEIHAASSDNLFWELWRDLPEEYIDGVKVRYKVNSVKQILEDGTEIIYEQSDKLYWYDSDYIGYSGLYGPGKWFHSKGPYDGEYNFECVLFYVDGLYRETVVFEIEYEMYNASLRYNDASELYVSLYYGDSIKYLKSVKGEILIPSDKMPQDRNYSAYTYGTNSHQFPFSESDSIHPGYHTFSFELDESQLQFKHYNQYIEFSLITFGEDKHIFTQYAEVNNYYYADMLSDINKAQSEYEYLPIQAEKDKISVLVFSIFSSIGAIGVALLINFTIKKKYKFYKPFMDLEFFRDIPSDLDANFASRLVFSKHKKKDTIGDGYAAAMLSLVYKGYIELAQIDVTKDWKNTNVKIVVKHNPNAVQTSNPVLDEINTQIAKTDLEALNIAPLSPIEERYLNLIVRHSNGGEISHSSFQKKISSDYEYTTTFVGGVKAALDRIGVSDGYFQKINYKSPRTTMRVWATIYIIIAVIVMLVVNLIVYYTTRLDLAYGSFFILGVSLIVAAIYLLNVSKKYFLLTQYGEDEYEKWYALYNFLNSETLMKERDVLELVIWEKYLIYATAFGISQKVIKALKIRCPETMINSSPILSHPHLRTSTFYSSSSRAFSNSTRSASYTSRSGGYGGFGGGGRGGGGGGGGH